MQSCKLKFCVMCCVGETIVIQVYVVLYQIL